jgi:hypothetical protein
MKKLTIIGSILTVAAFAATLWQLHNYNLAIRQTFETENAHIREAMAHTELMAAGREHTIAQLETQLKVLTNRPAEGTKTGNS